MSTSNPSAITCLACYRLTKLCGSPATCARCAANKTRRSPPKAIPQKPQQEPPKRKCDCPKNPERRRDCVRPSPWDRGKVNLTFPLPPRVEPDPVEVATNRGHRLITEERKGLAKRMICIKCGRAVLWQGAAVFGAALERNCES